MTAESRLGLAKRGSRVGLPFRGVLMGPTKSGKTRTGLHVATVLRGDDPRPILGIDTEHGRMLLYADKHEFEHIPWLPPFDPNALIQTLNEASGAFSVIFIDSLSHFWSDEGGLLALVDAYKAAHSSGDSKQHGLNAWAVIGTPLQKKLVDALLASKGHILVGMRQKMAYEIDTGTNRVRKLGLQPVQRDDIEYEFDVIGTLNMEHQIIVQARGYLDGKVYPPGRADDFAQDIVRWLKEAPEQRDVPIGTAAVEAKPAAPDPDPPDLSGEESKPTEEKQETKAPATPPSEGGGWMDAMKLMNKIPAEDRRPIIEAVGLSYQQSQSSATMRALPQDKVDLLINECEKWLASKGSK